MPLIELRGLIEVDVVIGTTGIKLSVPFITSTSKSNNVIEIHGIAIGGT